MEQQFGVRIDIFSENLTLVRSPVSVTMFYGGEGGLAGGFQYLSRNLWISQKEWIQIKTLLTFLKTTFSVEAEIVTF